MFEYTMREDSRKRFPRPGTRKCLPAATITAVRCVGPHWIIAGRRRRAIPVFLIRTTLLSSRAAHG
jgi:hypothetical protein